MIKTYTEANYNSYCDEFFKDMIDEINKPLTEILYDDFSLFGFEKQEYSIYQQLYIDCNICIDMAINEITDDKTGEFDTDIDSIARAVNHFPVWCQPQITARIFDFVRYLKEYNDDETVAFEIFEIATGKDWKNITLTGYAQSEYQNIYIPYDTDENSDFLRDLACLLFGGGAFFKDDDCDIVFVNDNYTYSTDKLIKYFAENVSDNCLICCKDGSKGLIIDGTVYDLAKKGNNYGY